MPENIGRPSATPLDRRVHLTLANAIAVADVHPGLLEQRGLKPSVSAMQLQLSRRKFRPRLLPGHGSCFRRWRPTMRKVEAATLASLDDYRLVDAAVPSPKAGEVLVRVAACGVGYVDALVALGRYQVKPSLPHTPGQEAGGFAEFAAAPATSVIRLPERMTFAQAAGFRINYLTALHGLRDRGGVKAGETVVVLGAAGGLGAAAVQVAKRLGAHVIAAASTPEKRDICRRLGADETLETAPEGWRDRLKAACDGKGPDVVFDPVCGPLFEPSFRSLRWGGRHLVLGFVGGPIPALPVNLPLMKGAALVGVDVRQFMLFEPERAAAQLAELLAWVGDGRLDPPVGSTFGLEDFGAALTFALSGRGAGKTILEVAR
jgi:NADPH:quinone reductase